MSNQPGDKSTCNLCGAEIWWTGLKWNHSHGSEAHIAAPAGGVVIGNEEDDDESPPVGVVLPYHRAPDEEDTDEPPAVCVVSSDMTPREAADALRSLYTPDEIVTLLVCLLDPAAEGRKPMEGQK
jgi:hypothetical protein